MESTKVISEHLVLIRCDGFLSKKDADTHLSLFDSYTEEVIDKRDNEIGMLMKFLASDCYTVESKLNGSYGITIVAQKFPNEINNLADDILHIYDFIWSDVNYSNKIQKAGFKGGNPPEFDFLLIRRYDDGDIITHMLDKCKFYEHTTRDDGKSIITMIYNYVITNAEICKKGIDYIERHKSYNHCNFVPIERNQE